MVEFGRCAVPAWRYRGQRRVHRGEMSTREVVALARSTREAELVDLVVAPLERRGKRYGSAAGAYRGLGRLGDDIEPLWHERWAA